MTTESALRLIACFVLCVGGGGFSGSVTGAEIRGWYAQLVRPSWTPPNWVFPVAWAVLYIMMSFSLWLLWDRAEPSLGRTLAISMFLVQFALNLAWSPVFFLAHRPRAAMYIIVAMALAIAGTIALAWPVDRTAALLLAPYLVWAAYATTLNAGIIVLNPSVS